MGLNSVDKHIDRVAYRVSVGGHHIDTDTIRKRFDLRDENLEKSLLRSDNFTLFDNSNKEPKLSLEYNKDRNSIYLLTDEKWVVNIAEKISQEHNIQIIPITEEQKNKLDELLEKLNKETINSEYPNLANNDIEKIEMFKNAMLKQYTTPQAQQAILEKIQSQLPDIASGKITLPDLPTQDKDKGGR